MLLKNLLQQRGIKFLTSPTNPQEIKICCPFCPIRGETVDTRFRLGINVVTGEGHCFNCGWAARKGADRKVFGSLATAGQQAVWSSSEENEPTTDKPTLPPEFIPFVKNPFWKRRVLPKDDAEAAALAYLLGRGVTKQQIWDNYIGYALTGKHGYRVIFPVYAYKHLAGFVARDFSGQQKMRYLNSTGEKALYNLPGSHKSYRSEETVVLSEGIFKSLSIKRALQPVLGECWYSLALLGHSITPLQLELLQQLKPQRVVVWPDPNRVGILGALDVCDALVARGIPSIQVLSKVPRVEADNLDAASIRRAWTYAAPYGWAVQMRLKTRISAA